MSIGISLGLLFGGFLLNFPHYDLKYQNFVGIELCLIFQIIYIFNENNIDDSKNANIK